MNILPLYVRDLYVENKEKKRIIGPINFEISKAGIIVLIGPNGSGKTTLLKALHGLCKSKGKITWSHNMHAARHAQSFVFQNPVLLDRSVIANIVYALRLKGFSAKKAYIHAQKWARFVGIEALIERPALSLSGGEKQKLSLARALSTKPEFLFLDEPCANLDGTSTSQIEALLQKVSRKGVCILLVSHNMEQARRLANHVLFMYRGVILENRPADEFFAHPENIDARRFIKGELLE